MTTSRPMCLVCSAPLPETSDGTRRYYHPECRKRRKKGRAIEKSTADSAIVAPTRENLEHVATLAAVAETARRGR